MKLTLATMLLPNSFEPMDEPPSSSQAGSESTVRGLETEPATKLAVTTLFGRYRVLRELGRGGMGRVVLAEDTVLGVEVAVKILPDAIAGDPDAVAGLRKEVLRGRALTHPGVVRVHTFEQDAGGAGIVMEFVEGETLWQRRARQFSGCFECEDILPWIEQICAILDYAHRDAQIVHRDLKPNNLLLSRATRDFPKGRIKVADFGLASTISESSSRHSREGTTSGTPPYMSPQQAMGEKPTHLDDIYSLGATIYDLLTGKPPFFRGANPGGHCPVDGQSACGTRCGRSVRDSGGMGSRSRRVPGERSRASAPERRGAPGRAPREPGCSQGNTAGAKAVQVRTVAASSWRDDARWGSGISFHLRSLRLKRRNGTR